MNLMLNDILNLTKEEIENSKIELSITAGKDGESYLEKWLMHSEANKTNGIVDDNDCCYYAWSKNRRNFQSGDLAFSFVQIRNDEWLFISAARIQDVIEGAPRAVIKILERFKPLFGRLIIKYRKPNAMGRFIFLLDGVDKDTNHEKKRIDNIIVKEILPSLYSKEEFEGYDKVYLSWLQLRDILSGKTMKSYRTALSQIKGVYCLTDKETGQLYIGSATGEEGVAQRWANYIDSNHGGNMGLIALYKKEGSSYFEENITFTLLEWFTLKCEKQKVLEREKYWKECFATREKGYNKN